MKMRKGRGYIPAPDVINGNSAKIATANGHKMKTHLDMHDDVGEIGTTTSPG